MDLLQTTKQVIFHPILFFESLAKRKNDTIGNALRFVVIWGIPYALLSMVMSLAFSALGLAIQGWIGTPAEKAALPVDAGIRVVSAIVGAGVMYVGMVVGSFVLAGLVWLWLALWKHQESYAKAYVLSVYSSAPHYVFGWIPLVNIFTGGWTLALLILGTINMYKVTPMRAVVMWVVSLVVLILLVLLLLAFGMTMLFGGLVLLSGITSAS